MQRFRGFKGFLFLILFLPVLVFGLTIDDINKIEGENPTLEEVRAYILEKSQVNNVPPVVFESIIRHETGHTIYKDENGIKVWRQFSTEGAVIQNYNKSAQDSKKNYIPPSYDLGICQFKCIIDEETGKFVGEEEEIRNLVKYWKINIDLAMALLIEEKWTKNWSVEGTIPPTKDDNDPLILENWFFPIELYNGYKGCVHPRDECFPYAIPVFYTINDLLKNVYNSDNEITIPKLVPYQLMDLLADGYKLHKWDKKTNTYKEYKLDICKNFEVNPNYSKFDGEIHRWFEDKEPKIWVQDCNDGSIVFWNKLTNHKQKHVFQVKDQILENYIPLEFGKPITDKILLPNNVICQNFEKKILLWDGENSISDNGSCGFQDVPITDKYYKAIKAIKDIGIVQGYNIDNKQIFKPNQAINRAEFLKIILLSKYKENEIPKEFCYDSGSFSDIEPKIWYKAYADFAKEKGIIKGYDDGTFGGNKNINFAEASKIIVNTLLGGITKITLISGGTVIKQPSDNWYNQYIEKLRKGRDINNIPPTKNITRGEMAKIIYEVIK